MFYKIFHLSKNKRFVGSKPFHGEPNTNSDTYNKISGRLVQRRKYDTKGQARVDYDAAGGRHSTDHAHDFNGRNRSAGRDLRPKEKREFGKAKKKRRFFR